MGDLRAAVLRHHRQLHRPADPVVDQADPRQPAALDQRAVRARERGVPGLVRGRRPAVRQVHRSLRHQDRLRDLDRGLEPGRRGACAGRQHQRLLHGTRRAGTGRGRKLPVGDQGGRALVPQEGADAGHDHLQLGRQRRRHARARRRALARVHLGLALGVHRGGCGRDAVATSVDSALQRPGEDRAAHARRARPYPQRHSRSVVREARRHARALAPPSGVVLHRREVPDRPGVVVLPDLAAGLLQKDAPPGHQDQLDPPGDHLQRGDGAQHHGWVAHRISLAPR